MGDRQMGNNKYSRRQVLGQLGGAGVLPFLPQIARAAGSDALEQVDVEMASVRDTQVGCQVAIAEELDLFKAEGLDMKVHWTTSGADIITFLAGGASYLAAGGGMGGIILKTQNIPVKIISGLSDMSGAAGLGLGPNSRLDHPKDLEGKTLAFTEGTPTGIILTKMAEAYGFDAGKVKLISMDPPETVVAAVKGDVFGALTFQPYLARLTSLGGTIYATGTTMTVDGALQQLPFEKRFLYINSVMLASVEWIHNKPNTLKAVLRALLAANKVLRDDQPKAVSIIQERLKTDAQSVTAMLNSNGYSLAIDDALARSITFQSDWSRGLNRIPVAVSPDEVFEPNLLRQIDPTLVSWGANK